MSSRGAKLLLTVLALLAPRAVLATSVGFSVCTTTEDYATGEKPQSKLFFHDGSWWSVVQGPDGVAFYELAGNTWQRGAFMDAVLGPAGKDDVKWTGSSLLVLNYAATAQLFEYNYDAQLRVWLLQSGYPITLPKPSGTETMVLDQDSTGRIWVTTEGGGYIYAYYSAANDHRDWSAPPVILQSGVNPDDISAVIAFGTDRIGVYWSDQNRDEFGFRVHLDADAPTVWSAEEVVDAGPGYADDHLRLAADAAGRVYALTKDDFDRMQLHRRAVDGSWTTQYDVTGGIGTRGIIMVSEADQALYLVYTDWTVTPNPIAYRVADLETMLFGPSHVLMSASTNLNDATGTKQMLPAGTLVAMADGGNKVWWNGWMPAADVHVRPAAPTNLVATLQGAPTRIELAWSVPSTGTPDGYDVYVQVNGAASQKLNAALLPTPTFTHDAPPYGTLCYQVVAIANGLQGLASSSACIDYQPIAPPASPENLVATAIVPGSAAGALVLWFDSGQGQVTKDMSGNGNNGTLGSTPAADANDPIWVTGKAGSALQFDGKDDYVLVADSPSFDLQGSFSFEAWVRRSTGVKSCILDKGAVGARTLCVSVTGTGAVEFIWDDRNGLARTMTTPAVIGDALWHHVACVYDGAALKNRVYIDGILRGAASASGMPALNTQPLYIGARPASKLKDPLKGAVEQLRLAPGVLYTTNFTPLSSPALPADAAPDAGRSVLIQWKAPTTGGAAIAYHIDRSVDAGAVEALAPTGVARTLFVDENVPAGALCYTVEGVNAIGEIGAPASVCLEGLVPTPPPALGIPLDLAVTRRDSSIAGPAIGNAVYAMDEGTGQTTLDATGHIAPAMLGSGTGTDSYDPTWLAGHTGTGLYFDGANDRVRLGDAPSLRLGSSFTLEAWVKRGSTGTSDCIINKGDTGTRNYSLMYTATGLIEFQWESTTGTVNTTTSISGGVTDTAWHHVAAVYDAAANENRIYLDGSLKIQGPVSGTPLTTADAAYLGAKRISGSFKSPYYGTIDLVRVAGWAVYAANFTPPLNYSAAIPQPANRLAWHAPASGAPAGYAVYRAVGGGSFVRLNPAPLAAAAYADLAPPDGACYRITALDASGNEGPPCDAVCAPAPAPKPEATPDAAVEARVALGAAPNPFNPVTVLRFALPHAARARLEIYSVRGERVTTLVDGPLGAGAHAVRWEGRAADGRPVASGVYFAMLRADGDVQRLKLLMLK